MQRGPCVRQDAAVTVVGVALDTRQASAQTLALKAQQQRIELGHDLRILLEVPLVTPEAIPMVSGFVPQPSRVACEGRVHVRDPGPSEGFLKRSLGEPDPVTPGSLSDIHEHADSGVLQELDELGK